MRIIKRHAVSGLFALLALIFAACAEAQINYQIQPSAPQGLEAVRLRTTYISGDTACYYGGARSMSGNKITVIVSCGITVPLPTYAFDVDLGRFPPGVYAVEAVSLETKAVLFSGGFTVAETHTVTHYPYVDYTDHWWNAQESGWGLSIMQHPSDRLFAVWFVYNQAKQPVWYTLQGSWVTFSQFSGPIYKTAGPYFGGPFDPSQVGITQVGAGTLSFSDSNTGQFSYTVEGVTGTKPITRLPF